MSQVTQYLLLGGYVLVGLWAYERFGVRLGGVLALPLVAIYGLIVPWAVEIFALAALVAFAAGELLHRHTLLYGRRLFAAHIVASVLASYAGAQILGADLQGFLLPVLPGVFAFNLHREGQPGRQAAYFGVAVIALMVVGLAVESLVTIDPAAAVEHGVELTNPGTVLQPCIDWARSHLGTAGTSAAIGGTTVVVEWQCGAVE